MDLATTATTTVPEISVSNALPAASKVSLVSTEIGGGYTLIGRSSIAINYSFKAKVELANLAYAKKVWLHYTRMGSTVWQDAAFVYSSTTAAGNEIWNLTLNGGTSNSEKVDQYVIKYEVNGQTYWDNNNGTNYRVDQTQAGLPGYYQFYLRNDLNVLLNSQVIGTSVSNDKFVNFGILIKNLAYNKMVSILYSTDKWKTNKTANFNFIGSYPNGFEIWGDGGSFNLLSNVGTPGTRTFDYAIVYKVNGQEYWDNNFGKNYSFVY